MSGVPASACADCGAIIVATVVAANAATSAADNVADANAPSRSSVIVNSLKFRPLQRIRDKRLREVFTITIDNTVAFARTGASNVLILSGASASRDARSPALGYLTAAPTSCSPLGRSVHARSPFVPGLRLLQLPGQTQQGGFVAEPANELHADGESVGRHMHWQ